MEPSILLRGDRLRAANRADGINVVVFANVLPDLGDTTDEAFVGRRLLMESFFVHHRGFNVREMLAECIGAENLQLHENGGMVRRSDYAPYYMETGLPVPDAARRPYLVGIDRAEAVANPSTNMAELFVYTPPVFSFPKSEQVMLHRALSGLTDDDLARELNLSLWTVKKKWQTIYSRVASVNPDFFPVARTQARGAEKRRRLLQYLRLHTEELRP
jgi:hypothetical protein